MAFDKEYADMPVAAEAAPAGAKAKGRLPFGFRFAEPMATPPAEITDRRMLTIYACWTHTTSTPEGPDNPVEDTER